MTFIEGRPKEAIVEAASRLFSRYGPSKTSVREIAGEAGLSKATVYNHFGSKDQIVEAVVEIERGRLVGKIRRAVEGAEGGVEALEAFIRTRVREIQRLHKLYRAEREDYLHFMPIVARAIEASRRDEQLILLEILRRGEEEGVFRPQEDMEMVADLVFSIVLSVTFPLFGHLLQPAPARLEGLVHLVLKGICAERPGAD